MKNQTTIKTVLALAAAIVSISAGADENRFCNTASYVGGGAGVAAAAITGRSAAKDFRDVAISRENGRDAVRLLGREHLDDAMLARARSAEMQTELKGLGKLVGAGFALYLGYESVATREGSCSSASSIAGISSAIGKASPRDISPAADGAISAKQAAPIQ